MSDIDHALTDKLDEQARRMLGAWPHGAVLCDGQDRVLWHNAAFEAMTGLAGTPAAATLAESLIAVLRQPADADRVRALAAPRAEGDVAARDVTGLIIRSADGRGRSLDIHVAPLAHGIQAWFFTDRTDLHHARRNLNALLRHSGDGIFLLDEQCRTEIFNRACEQVTGYRAEEMLGHDRFCREVLGCAHGDCPNGAGDGASALGFRAGEAASQTREGVLQPANGDPRHVELTYTVIQRDPEGPPHLLGLLRDVTQRHQLEQQLSLSRKLATLGELTSAMAHEIKNPLGVILSSAEIVKNPDRPEEQRRLAAGFIEQEAKRLDERIKLFLKFSRPKPPSMQRHDLHKLLLQTILLYRTLSGERLNLWTNFSDELPDVMVDADQIQQAVLNLIMNADQAMQGDGQIDVSTQLDPHGAVQVAICDRGPGLPEGEAERIFEPFFSTKPKGSGLGLSIVMQIINDHRGRIEAAARIGGGACFMVTLPPAPEIDSA